jgi:hypothetical protein
MAKKAMVIAPNRMLALLAAEKAGFRPNEFVWIGEPEQLMGINGGKYVEAVSNRPFDALETDPGRKKKYFDVCSLARDRWSRVDGSTWTQVYMK